MNSASMATNLLGQSVRLRERPLECTTDRGTIVLVSIDDRGVHFLVQVEGRLIPVDSVEQLVVTP